MLARMRYSRWLVSRTINSPVGMPVRLIMTATRGVVVLAPRLMTTATYSVARRTKEPGE